MEREKKKAEDRLTKKEGWGQEERDNGEMEGER